ncbi:MAG TPA: phage holin family protein [Longimicrobiaceae bacterium]|jgi:putative membrane protein
MSLLLRWVASAAAVAAAVYLVEGIRLQGGAGAFFGVALILGFANAIVRPILRALACGLIFLTLGLFLLVINAAMLLLTEAVSQSLGLRFEVDGFGAALLGSVVISLVTFLASLLLDRDDR